MEIIDILVLSLSTWYIAYVITVQDGPYGVFYYLRRIKRFNNITSCIYCIAPYIAGIVYVMFYHGTPLMIDIIYVFSIAGVALMLRSYTGVGMNGV